MNKLFTLSALATATWLGACASTPTPPQELLAARAAVRAAESEPRVMALAPLELRRATEALNRANALDAQGESLADVASAAYVAQQQARTAQAMARAKADEEAIKSTEADRERARADARTREAERAQRQAAVARADAASARGEAASARGEAATAQQQAAMAQQQAAAAQDTASQARDRAARLQAQLDELQARPTERGALVTLGDLLFEFGRAELKPASGDALRKLAAYLQQQPERLVLIEGFTDSVGHEAANLQLSQRRAEAVARALGSLGVAPQRISIRGWGEAYPVADNATDTNRALNRRVEVYISDNDQPVRGRSG